MLKLRKYPPKGFTLIELLVVVLIIGILAAIALPQYKVAVGKVKLATVKNATESILQAEQRYYLVHNEYTTDLSALDIELPNNANCIFADAASSYCQVVIFGVTVQYANNGEWRRAIVYSRDENDTANKVCKQDSGGNAIIREGLPYIYYNYL